VWISGQIKTVQSNGLHICIQANRLHTLIQSNGLLQASNQARERQPSLSTAPLRYPFKRSDKRDYQTTQWNMYRFKRPPKVSNPTAPIEFLKRATNGRYPNLQTAQALHLSARTAPIALKRGISLQERISILPLTRQNLARRISSAVLSSRLSGTTFPSFADRMTTSGASRRSSASCRRTAPMPWTDSRVLGF
jgi:hypothetical protein